MLWLREDNKILLWMLIYLFNLFLKILLMFIFFIMKNIYFVMFSKKGIGGCWGMVEKEGGGKNWGWEKCG